MIERKCGDCSLCCKLLPMHPEHDTAWRKHSEVTSMFDPHGMAMRSPDKVAGVPCPHQKHHKGCTKYLRRPMGCRVWNCAWLVNHNHQADALHRPDRAGYVVDINPDFVRCTADGESTPVEVIQVWVDPKRPEAHRDPKLRAYLARQNKCALIRFNERDGLVLIPPSWASDDQWHEIDCGRATLKSGATWPDDVRAVVMMDQ